MTFEMERRQNVTLERSSNLPGEREWLRLLESELRLESSDLRSNAWYHGSISRSRAEEVVLADGEFLVRDCISDPGNFVLTSRRKGKVLHVVIQKTTLQRKTIYERIQYLIEDESYDSIPALIRAYVGGRIPVTRMSGAIISKPVNRTAPLSLYLSKYSVEVEGACLKNRPISLSRRLSIPCPDPVSVGCRVVRTPTFSPPRLRRTPSGTATRSRGQRPLSGTFEVRSSSTDGVSFTKVNAELASSFNSLPRRFHNKMPNTSSSVSSKLTGIPLDGDINQSQRMLLQSDNQNSPRNPRWLTPTVAYSSRSPKHFGPLPPPPPPPKPSRVSSCKRNPPVPSDLDLECDAQTSDGERVYEEIDDDLTPTASEESTFASLFPKVSDVYHHSGSDSGNGSGDSVQTSGCDSRRLDIEGAFSDSATDLFPEGESSSRNSLTMPEVAPRSCFDLEKFYTLLLPSIENKPLDETALRGISNILLESGSRTLAAHITHCDLKVLNFCRAAGNFGPGVTMGIELITLPQGSQLRKDLIERTECLKLLVIVSILKTQDVIERSRIVHRWICVAIDTKTAIGNLYSFTGIMLGLCAPEIQRLSKTWRIVRQKYTEVAFNFESKLRLTSKSMNECTNPQAPNTTIPHLLPLLLIFERDLEQIYSLHNREDSLLHWEGPSDDWGLQILYSHLQEGRNFTSNLSLYKTNAEVLLKEFARLEELTLDMFRTEFQLKFLFGSKAAHAPNHDRMPKFQKVIATLSEFCEPSESL